MNFGLIAASALAGWTWTTVIGEQGNEIWFFIAGLCGIFLGVALHQLITRGRWLLTLLCLAAFAGSTAAAHARGLSAQQTQTQKPREPVFVKAEKVATQTFTEQFTFSGVIAPERSALLAFAAGELIQELHVDDNDRVRAGQKLAQLNTDQLAAGLKEAEAVCAQAASNLERFEKLLAQDATSEALRENAMAEDEVAKARVKALKARLEAMTLKAPFAGQIASRFAETGEYASPGKPIFKLLVLDPVKAIIGVPEKMIGLIRPNAPASIVIDALDTSGLFQGHVTLIASETAEGSPLYSVEITIPNDAGELKPGMAARISIKGSTYENATLLKTSWVQRTGGQHVIFQLAPLDAARDEFMAQHDLNPEQLQEIVALIADPANVGIARRFVLKDFVIRDSTYVVRDALARDPVITRGAYLLQDLSIVRTGVLKRSEGIVKRNGEED